MFKKFKSITLLMVIALIASIALIGCGNSKDTGSNETSGGKEEKLYDITMTYWDVGNSSDLKTVQDEINKIVKEKINATVTLLPIDPGAYNQQINLMMTSNEKLDLLLTGTGMNYNLQAVKGQLVALDDLLESHGQGIKEVIPADMLEATKVDGKIYSVPNTRDWAKNYGYYVRKDLLEKYNLDLSQVKTFEDLTPIFKTIKENEPTMYPIANTTTSIANIIYGKDIDPLGDSLGVITFNDDSKVVNLFETEEYEHAVTLAREWYEAGYVLKDSATSNDTPIGVMKAGKGAGAFAAMKPGFAEQESLGIGHDMVAVELSEAIRYTDGATGIMMGVAKNSQNPEKAMEFLNLMFTDADVMNLLLNGVEGKHYVENEDGMLTLPEGQAERTYSQVNWQLGNSYLTKLWEGDIPDLWDQTEAFNANSTPSPAFGFAFNADSVKTEIAAVSNVTEQYRRGLESGTLDPAKSLPEFNKKLKDAGLDKIIAEKQKQYDEWKVNK